MADKSLAATHFYFRMYARTMRILETERQAKS